MEIVLRQRGRRAEKAQNQPFSREDLYKKKRGLESLHVLPFAGRFPASLNPVMTYNNCRSQAAEEKAALKKIVILNGSPRKNGNTAGLIKAFAKGAESSGNQVTEFYLQGMNIKECLGCKQCGLKEYGPEKLCVQKDDMCKIYASFLEADVVVFASPVYWWTITGTLKTVVDRLYSLYHPGSNPYPKESILLLTAGGEYYSQVLEWYAGFETWLGWKNLGTVLGSRNTEAAEKLGASIG